MKYILCSFLIVILCTSCAFLGSGHNTPELPEEEALDVERLTEIVLKLVSRELGIENPVMLSYYAVKTTIQVVNWLKGDRSRSLEEIDPLVLEIVHEYEQGGQ